MKCIVELFGDDRNGRKMIAWGRRIGCADAEHVFDPQRRKVAQTFRPLEVPQFFGHENRHDPSDKV
jgi:hypothetical protein